MEKIIPTRIGKHSLMTQEEADKRKAYRFFMHSDQKGRRGNRQRTRTLKLLQPTATHREKGGCQHATMPRRYFSTIGANRYP